VLFSIDERERIRKRVLALGLGLLAWSLAR
jgi:hypothetical protein